MSIGATHDQALTPAAPTGAIVHPLWVRLTHWTNAVAMVVMIGSGWEIYNASPLFPFVFPPRDHPRRLACGRAALALRGNVAIGGEWSRLSPAWYRDWALPAQARSDPPRRGLGRCQSRIHRKARPR